MMQLVPLAWRSLVNRRFAALMTGATLALSVCLLLMVERVRVSAQESFASTVSGTDLIVGARTGATALLLYSVFHVGEASNDVSWASYAQIAALPEVAWSVPISLGDSHRGFRVVGTEGSFFEHIRFGAKRRLLFQSGQPFASLHQAVLGQEVARSLGYRLGDRLALSHGLASTSLHGHDDQPFEVVGILQATGTPIDATVMVSLESIEAIHADWQSGVHIPGSGQYAAASHQPSRVTAFLLGLKSRASTFTVQRYVNEFEEEPLQAILPGIALQQLWSITGGVERAFRLVSMAVVVISLAGMVTAMVTMLSARRREMAILRSLGARPAQVAGMWILEALFICMGGILMGCLLLHVSAYGLERWLLERHGYALDLSHPALREVGLLLGVVAAGVLAGVIPAVMAYRRTLADGLSWRN